ncbi:hypothetical protein [Spirosoma pollinicola]|uniref:hypothetical protein n=1 Tax=Spirosoma pollinicola TaxID=2057025 RepID=UPI0012FE3F08|nr:hypothetical protein [Spirosoma pollinicola]
MTLTFPINRLPALKAIIDLFDHSSYHPTRKNGDRDRLKQMHDRANLLVTA